MYTRFCVKLFIVCFLYGFIVLIPIHATDDLLEVWWCCVCPRGLVVGDGLTHVAQDPGTLDSWSMSNVQAGSSRLWAHVVGSYLFSFVAYKLLLDLYREVWSKGRCRRE